MQGSLKVLVRGIAVFVLTCVVAVAGYCLAGWTFLDAVYMTAITVFSVGYGEVQPITDPRLKYFTILVIVAGCSSAIYVIGGVVQMLAEGEFNRVLGARRMTKGIEQLSNHCIMCGYGRVGQHLAEELRSSQQKFVIIDSNMERLRDAEAAGFLVIVGDATEERVLLMAGIERAKVVACVLSDDAANVFLTLTARELNPKVEIIARAELNSTEKKLIRSGASRVVLPTAIGATKIANLISRPSAESLLDDEVGRQHLNEELEHIGLELQEFALGQDSVLIGQRISSIELSGQGGFVIVALRHADGRIVRRPDSELLLAQGDTIIALGHEDQIVTLGRRAEARSDRAYRGGTR